MGNKEVKRRLGRYLSIDKEYLGLIFNGVKVTTIRKGLVVPSVDIVYLKSDGKTFGELKIESTKYVKAKDLTDEDARLDGFRDKEELMRGLLKYYPDLKPEDWVTIIRFKLLRKMEGLDNGDIARLALAYGLFANERERRILSMVARGGSKDAIKELLGVSENYISGTLERALKRLKEKGII